MVSLSQKWHRGIVQAFSHLRYANTLALGKAKGGGWQISSASQIGSRGFFFRWICQPGFFVLDNRYALFSKSVDRLERLASAVNIEVFRHWLEKVLKRSNGSKGGRPRRRLLL